MTVSVLQGFVGLLYQKADTVMSPLIAAAIIRNCNFITEEEILTFLMVFDLIATLLIIAAP